MKKFLIMLSMLMLLVSAGCTVTKNNYNVAYITEDFLTAHKKDTSPAYVDEMNKYTSNIFWTSDTTYYARIKSWDYGKNDTIILELDDGRTLQTASENVILMYDPDIY